MPGHDTSALLKRIRQPTLVLGGTVDPICSPRATQALATGLPQATLEMFDGASHFFMIEQAERFNSLLAAWLSQQTSPTIGKAAM